MRFIQAKAATSLVFYNLVEVSRTFQHAGHVVGRNWR